MKRFTWLLLVSILLAACTPRAAAPTPTLTATLLPPTATATATLTASPTAVPASQQWWGKAVFYEIFVRSFYDSNGDGIGDFNGITEKLDYLQSLGINAIWLMPIHPSPSYHGYDVIDYFKVNPDYGTMDDFRRLVAEVHKRDMHLIIDLVLNHTSSQNPWFIDANSDPQSAYRNWYIWSDTNPSYLSPTGGPAWHKGLHGYYYGIFSDSMPDLNYRNPAVTAEMVKVVQFWLKDVGIDGFRLDAAKHLIEEGLKQENTQSTHYWLKQFYTYYKGLNPQAFTVGEIFNAGASLAKTYTGNQMDEVFSFELASGFVNSAQAEVRSSVDSGVQFTLNSLPDGPYATFLTNHDQNRVMSSMYGNVEEAKMAAALMLTSPGTPFIYYGEEVGMEGEKPDPQIRMPMQWSAEANAGFTTGTPWEANTNDYSRANVATELTDPQSLLYFYRTLLRLRNENPVFSAPGIGLVTSSDSGVYAAFRYSDQERVLVVINLTKNPISQYTLSQPKSTLPDGSYHLQALLGTESPADLNVTGGKVGDYVPLAELPAYSVHIYQIEP